MEDDGDRTLPWELRVPYNFLESLPYQDETNGLHFTVQAYDESVLVISFPDLAPPLHGQPKLLFLIMTDRRWMQPIDSYVTAQENDSIRMLIRENIAQYRQKILQQGQPFLFGVC